MFAEAENVDVDASTPHDGAKGYDLHGTSYGNRRGSPVLRVTCTAPLRPTLRCGIQGSLAENNRPSDNADANLEPAVEPAEEVWKGGGPPNLPPASVISLITAEEGTATVMRRPNDMMDTSFSGQPNQGLCRKLGRHDGHECSSPHQVGSNSPQRCYPFSFQP